LADVTLDLGHVGIYEAVLEAASLTTEQEKAVFDALQRKSIPDLERVLSCIPAEAADHIFALAQLHGDDTVLDRASAAFATIPAAVKAVETLAALSTQIRALQPTLSIYFDLAELRGYHYHTGLVFAAYVPGHGQALANGGRYNDVGEVFGRARAATGFNTDLKALVNLLEANAEQPAAISAPHSKEAALHEEIERLRSQGEVVISCLSAQPDERCNRELVEIDGQWCVEVIGVKAR